MPKNPGPGDLNEVKSRLRQEQVERERAASLRYRQQEERDQGGNRDETSQSNCVLFLLILCLFLLALCLLLLSGTVFSLVLVQN